MWGMTIASHCHEAQHTTEESPLAERHNQPKGKVALKDLFYKEIDFPIFFSFFLFVFWVFFSFFSKGHIANCRKCWYDSSGLELWKSSLACPPCLRMTRSEVSLPTQSKSIWGMFHGNSSTGHQLVTLGNDSTKGSAFFAVTKSFAGTPWQGFLPLIMQCLWFLS